MLQEFNTVFLVVSLVLAPLASVLVHLLMVIIHLYMWLRRRGVPLRFPLWLGILKVALLVLV
jgi:hypothetical protein